MAEMNKEDLFDLLSHYDSMSSIERAKLKKKILQKDYISYVKYVHKGLWYAGKHLEYLCEKIELLLQGNLYNNGNKVRILTISMPPQHGKSQAITETLPSWYIGNNPNKRMIIVSYNTDFARRFGRRNIVKIKEYGKDLFNLELSKESDDEIEVKGNTGTIISRGIMSGITGNPGDVIIIDDPVKNREEADSETYREKMWDEYLNSVKTRLSANGVIIVIATRWHEDDLIGRIKANEGSKVMEINFPCEAEDNDILGRKIGEPLFPEIGKDKDWLEDFKKSYITKEGKRTWLALFQGRPTADEGNMLKRQWWKFYDTLPEWFDEQIQSWDCTFKDSDGSDYVVGQVWGRVGATYYLLDQVRQRMNIVETMTSIEHMTSKWSSALLKLIEDKANGSAVIQILQTKVPGIIPIEPQGGKMSRASAVSPAIEAGNVYLPNPSICPWILDFIEECSAFPNGAHDDQVDAMSQALNRFIYYTNDTKPKESVYPINSIEYRVQQNLENLASGKRKKKESWF